VKLRLPISSEVTSSFSIRELSLFSSKACFSFQPLPVLRGFGRSAIRLLSIIARAFGLVGFELKVFYLLDLGVDTVDHIFFALPFGS